MAVSDFTPAPKPHVYDLLNSLNAAFGRVRRNMEALEQTGIFEPEMMKRLSRLSERSRAESNSNLLQSLQANEQRELASLLETP